MARASQDSGGGLHKSWRPFLSGALYNLPSAVDGEAVIEGEEGFAVAERGSLAQAPQVVGRVAQVAGEVRVAAVHLSRHG